jgi:arylsulfatase A-like enzyme
MNIKKISLFLTCLASLAGVHVNAADSVPNILLIVADDMGLTDLGAFGSEINTPNLDKLASEGVRLTNYHAHPQCAPTRSMLMSGADNHTAGMGSMFGGNFMEGDFGNRPGYERHLHPRVATLPERLGDAGYHTYMAGKWHLGEDDEKKPTAKGFDKAFALINGSASHMEMRGIGPGETVYREDGKVLKSLPENFFSANTYTDKMIEYIASNQSDDKPFFGYLALTSPHWPMQAPPEFRDRYAGQYDDGYDALRAQRVKRATEMGIVPDVDADLFDPIGASWDELTKEEQRYASRTMEIYAGMVDNMDHNIGRIMAYLEEIDELDNTLIFFMSDNGAESDRGDRSPTFKGRIKNTNYYENSYENLGTASSWAFNGPGWAQAAMAPYRLYKGFSAEGGTLVSAIVYQKDMKAASTINDQYLSVMDVMPTFLDVAEAKYDETQVRGRPVEPMKGKSFTSILNGKSTLVHPADEVMATELHGQRALVRGDWKILWEQRPMNMWWDDEPAEHWKQWRLFNLKDDPTEQKDLSQTNPKVRDELIAQWHEFSKEHNILEEINPIWPQPRGQ